MTTSLYLIRHGQTAYNVEKRFQGQLDMPLNKEGVRQASLLADRLKALNFSALYSSDLERTQKTAAPLVKEKKMDLILCPALREIDFGHWQGRRMVDLLEGESRQARDWQARPLEVDIPGGETQAQIKDRTMGFIEKILARHGGQNIALFSHGGPIRYMLVQALGLPAHLFWKMDIDNTSISVLRYKRDCFHLHKLNDTGHLVK